MARVTRALGVRLSGGWPGWMASLVVFAITAAGVASGPVFLEAVADALADDVIATGSPIDTAVTMRSDVTAFSESFQVASDAVGDSLGAIEGLESGGSTYAVGASRTNARAGDRYLGSQVRVIYRDGAIDALDSVVDGGGGPGAWISSIAADDLGVGPGELITVSDPEWSFEVPVAGVYRDFDSSEPGPYWRLLPGELMPRYRAFYRVFEPQLVIVDEATFFSLANGLAPSSGDTESSISLGVDDFAPLNGRAFWQSEPLAGGTGGDLLRIADDVRSLQTRANDPTTPLGALLFDAGMPRVLVESELLDLGERVAAAKIQISPALTSVQAMIALIGVVVIGLGAWFVARRRIVELRMWTIEGRSAWNLGWWASLGAAVPGSIGTAAGAALTPSLVALVGPSQVRHHEAIPLVPVIAVAVVGLALVGMTTGVVAARVLVPEVRTRSRRWIWDIGLYGVAVTMFVQLLMGVPVDPASGDADFAAILFPVVGVAALTAAVIRLVAAVLGRFRSRGGGLPLPLFLTWRRLAAAAGSLGIVFPIAVATGVAVFSSSLVASLDEALVTKAVVAVGSNTSAPLPRSFDPEGIPDRFSVVRSGSGVTEGSRPVRLLLIDPDTYPAAVPWTEAFGMTMDDVVSALTRREGERVPVLIAGPGRDDEPVDGVRRTQKLTLAFTIVGELEAVPSMSPDLATLVMSRDAVIGWARENQGISGLASLEAGPDTAEAENELLLGLLATLVSIEGEDSMVAYLESIDRPTNLVAARADALSQAAFAAPRWAFEYLRMLAFAGMALAIGVFAYATAESRRRRILAHALVRRMGLSRMAAAGQLGLEVTALITLAIAVGMASAALLAVAVMGEFDPLPGLLPGLRTALAPEGFIASVVVGLVGASVVWLFAHRATVRGDVAEVLRVG